MERPPPLKGTDDNKSGFTYTSITKRLPIILNQMINENKFDEEIVSKLRDMEKDIVSDGVIKHFIANQDSARKSEIELWQSTTEKYLNKSYLEVPWYRLKYLILILKVFCGGLFLQKNNGNTRFFYHQNRSF